jgi:hypothetical protein
MSGVDSALEIGGITVEERLVGGGIDFGISSQSKEPGGSLDVELFALVKAKGEELVVGARMRARTA